MSPVNEEDHALISDGALRSAAESYLASLRAKQSRDRPEPLGIFDKWFVRVVTRLSALDQGRPWDESVKEAATAAGQGLPGQGLEWDFLRLRLFLERWRQGRLVTYDQRERSGVHYHPKYGTEFGIDVFLTCQGAPASMQWNGLPLMKTVFDFAIYPQLLAELRPRTVFEIGSGSGASAMWLADHMALLKIAGHVHSVDITPAKEIHRGVTFHQGDCYRPEALFSAELLSIAPHPWLVVEDAHHNVEAVLSHFHSALKTGDCVYVEDSEIKRGDIRRFLSRHPGCYLVDTKYTDFFGRNATCALDSIFVKTMD
jgi:cephalosporin hydroxylase